MAKKYVIPFILINCVIVILEGFFFWYFLICCHGVNGENDGGCLFNLSIKDGFR